MSLRHAAPALLLAALLGSSPLAVADPVGDAYTSVVRAVQAADGAGRAIAEASLAAAVRTAESAARLAGPFGATAMGLANHAAATASGAVPDEYVGLGLADARFHLQSGDFACRGMTLTIEHRPALSNEPNFLFSAMAGDGLPTVACKTGIRNSMSQHEWSGSPEEGWHGQQLNTGDAQIIDITIGPVDAEGKRAVHVYWVTLPVFNETYVIDGWIRDTL